MRTRRYLLRVAPNIERDYLESGGSIDWRKLGLRVGGWLS